MSLEKGKRFIYTNETKRYDHLPNMLLILLLKNITDLLRHGLYKTLAVSCCFWHQYFSSRSFTSCRL